MAWNGLGTYVLNPAYSPESNGSVIDATRYNGLTSDLATGITQALNKNGENSPTTNINWGGFKLTNLGAPTTAGDALRYGSPATLGATTITAAAGVGLTVTGFTGSNIADFIIAQSGAVATLRVKNTGTGAGTKTRVQLDDGTADLGYLEGDANGTTVSLKAVNRNNALDFWTGSAGGAQRMVIDATGNVGIGAAPTYALHATRSGSSGIIAATSTDASGVTAYLQANSNVDVRFGSITAVPIKFIINGVSVFNITAAGAITDVNGNTLTPVITKVKTAATTRISTAVLAADPHLAVPLTVGSWAVKVTLHYGVAVSGAPDGFQYNFTNTGTITDDSQFSYGLDKALTLQGRLAFATGGSISTNTTGATNWLIIEGYCTVTVAGTLTFQWAQAVSGAHNLTLAIGSSMVCTKVG